MKTPRIVIIGAGPAGTRAAQELVASGLRPTIIDENPASGGQIYRRPPPGFMRPGAVLYGTEAGRAREVQDAFDTLAPHVDHYRATVATGLDWQADGSGCLRFVHAGRVGETTFDALIVATGATDRLLPVPGWEQAGTYTLGAMQIALKAQGCALGSDVAFMGTGPLLYLVAAQYARAGAGVSAVIDTSGLRAQARALPFLAARPDVLAKGARLVAELGRRRIPLYRNARDLRIEHAAPGQVRAVRFAVGSNRIEVPCNAVGLGFHLRAETQLADLAGCRFDFDPLTRQWLPRMDIYGRTTRTGVYVCGDSARILGADGAETAGRLAARAVLHDHALPVLSTPDTQALLRARGRMVRFAKGLAIAFPWPHAMASAMDDTTVLCRCEDVRAGEMRQAARDLDARDINRAKAFSRVGMGRCQGRYCGLAACEAMAALLGRPVAQVGRLRGQAPVRPLPVAARPVPQNVAGCPPGA